MAQETLEQYAEPLIKKGIAKALEGDTQMIRYCLDRLLPARRAGGVRISKPKLNQIQDIELAQQRIMEQVASGKINPSDGEKFHSMLQKHRDNLEGQAMEARFVDLEKRAREVKDRNRRR